MPKAVMPPRGTEFPSLVSADGLVVRRSTPEGEKVAFDFRDFPGALVLRQQVASVFARMVGPNGTWRSEVTSGNKAIFVRRVLEWCEAYGVKDLSGFDEEHWEGWKEHIGLLYARATAQELYYTFQHILNDCGLPRGQVLWRVNQRFDLDADDAATERPRRTRVEYTRNEFEALQEAAARQVWKAHKRLSRNYTLATTEPSQVAQVDAEKAAMLRRILAGEEPPLPEARDVLGPLPQTNRSGSITRHYLTMNANEVLAAFVWLTCLEGTNLTTLERLTTGDSAAAFGDPDNSIVTMQLDKPRRGPERRLSTQVWGDTGDRSIGRAYRLLKEATDPARHLLVNLGIQTDLLLVWGTVAKTASKFALTRHVAHSAPRPKSKNGGGKGGARDNAPWLPEGLRVNFQSLHSTYQTAIEPAPTHNTRRTHFNEYLRKSPAARRELAVVTTHALADLKMRAEQTTIRLTEASDVPADIDSGAKDTATVACKDMSHHPFTGVECTDNFLMCLACPNAVATRRHLPRLVLIHETLEDLRGTLSSTAWKRWEADYLRLAAFLERRVRLTPAERAASLRAATDADRQHVRHLLGGTYDA